MSTEKIATNKPSPGLVALIESEMAWAEKKARDTGDLEPLDGEQIASILIEHRSKLLPLLIGEPVAEQHIEPPAPCACGKFDQECRCEELLAIHARYLAMRTSRNDTATKLVYADRLCDELKDSRDDAVNDAAEAARAQAEVSMEILRADWQSEKEKREAAEGELALLIERDKLHAVEFSHAERLTGEAEAKLRSERLSWQSHDCGGGPSACGGCCQCIQAQQNEAADQDDPEEANQLELLTPDQKSQSVFDAVTAKVDAAMSRAVLSLPQDEPCSEGVDGCEVDHATEDGLLLAIALVAEKRGPDALELLREIVRNEALRASFFSLTRRIHHCLAAAGDERDELGPCECTSEQGDSDCPQHPTCHSCGTHLTDEDPES